MESPSRSILKPMCSSCSVTIAMKIIPTIKTTVSWYTTTDNKCTPFIYSMPLRNLYGSITTNPLGIKLYRQWPQLFYGNGRYISELDFFSNVTQNQETNKNIKQICVFCPTASHPIKICCNNRQKNTRLARGWTFFCLCCPSHTTKYNFQPFATGLLVPVTCSNPITQFYILYENFTPPTLFHLSLSSAVQHNLNNALDVTRNIIPKNICQRAPSCHKRHLLPFAMRQFNPNCAGYEMHSPLICDW